QRPERDHDVERVVEKLQVVGPLILRKIIQPMDKTSKVSVSEKAKCARNFDRIIEPLRRDIRLTNQCHTRHRSAFKLSLHRRECDRLVIADYLRLLVARRKRNQERCDQTNEGSRTQIKPGLDWMKIAQRVKRSDRGDNERAGYDRGQLIMRELHERPRIQQVRTHAG